MRTKPKMNKRSLRSVLVAAFFAVAAAGIVGGLSGTGGDVRADTRWPSVAESTTLADSTASTVDTNDSAGS
ncbi:hypothetical protein ACFZDK_12885 [Streptomyces sp. NPDC007901]|uniref:hypothetical protein n=1 Tax=Streptomyces sp. NPDC007901 TaxID=3364785 RepID=UPI0036E75F1E